MPRRARPGSGGVLECGFQTVRGPAGVDAVNPAHVLGVRRRPGLAMLTEPHTHRIRISPLGPFGSAVRRLAILRHTRARGWDGGIVNG